MNGNLTPPRKNPSCGSSHTHLVQHPPKLPNIGQPKKPIQFKRGLYKAFLKSNPILLDGQPAFEIDTHKMKIGDGRTSYLMLPYIGDNIGKEGKSAYELWKLVGNSGTVEEFLDSLVGPSGASAYEIWLSLGNEGTIVDFLDYIKGPKGSSAYQVWLDEGNEGTVAEFLNSLKGASAYDIWLDQGNEGTEQDFLDSLRGKSAYEIWKDASGEDLTEEEYIEATRSCSWGQF